MPREFELLTEADWPGPGQDAGRAAAEAAEVAQDLAADMGGKAQPLS